MACKKVGIHWWHFLAGLCNLNLCCMFSITEFAAVSNYSVIFTSSGESRRVGLVFALTVAILTTQLRQAYFKKAVSNSYSCENLS